MDIRKSRKSFWHFCKTIASDFYKEDRQHLKQLCHTLQKLYEGKLIVDGKTYRRLMINMPPRHGKSRTLVLFTQWVLGVENTNKIITCSYNDDLATDFSRYVRDGIMTTKHDEEDIVYNDIFPESKIKKGNASFQQWALEGQFFNYKGAGVGGSITGKGASITIVDDIVKSAEEAYNDNALDKLWRWYTGTFLSRLEEGGIQIINMTRWSKHDICGRLLEGEEADKWYVLKMEAYDEENDEMLCPELLSKDSYESLKLNMDEAIFRANYHQEPLDVKGKLYQNICTYDELPMDEEGNFLFEKIVAYVDTADTGKDSLCCIAAGIYKGESYILDVYFTKEGMEITEPGTADFLVKNNVNYCLIESNNGGRGFARNVERLIWERHNTRSVVIKWFHQSKNKMARILTNSSYVQEHIYFPPNWKDKWKEFSKEITGFQKEGKNKHDDAVDCLTGISEMTNENVSSNRKNYSGIYARTW